VSSEEIFWIILGMGIGVLIVFLFIKYTVVGRSLATSVRTASLLLTGNLAGLIK